MQLTNQDSQALSKRSLRSQYFYSVLAIFLLEQVINDNLGVALSVPFALLLMIALRIHVVLVKGILIGTPGAIVGMAFLIFYQLPSVFASPDDCTINAKFMATMVTFLFAAWAMRLIRPELIIFSNVGSKLLLYWIASSVILAQIGVDVMTIFGSETRVPSGFYTEPSHLALYLVPLVAYRLLNNFSDRITWITLALVFFFMSSATLAVGLLGVVVIKLSMKIGGKWVAPTALLLTMSLIGVLANNVSDNPIFDRIIGIFNTNEGGITSLSSAVWLNGWSQSFAHLTASNGWGVGLNRMGCGALEMSGYLSPLIMGSGERVLNSSDGSFMFAKIMAELGYLGLIICTYLSFLAIKSILALNQIANQEINSYFSPDDMIRHAAAGLTLLMYLYVRGMSYFAFPLMLAVAVLLLPPIRQRQTKT
jgi:hypothetical protein